MSPKPAVLKIKEKDVRRRVLFIKNKLTPKRVIKVYGGLDVIAPRIVRLCIESCDQLCVPGGFTPEEKATNTH